MLKLFFQRLFSMDPVLVDAYQRTKKLDVATGNGDNFFLICRPFANQSRTDKIECENNQIYIKQMPKAEALKTPFGRRWDD